MSRERCLITLEVLVTTDRDGVEFGDQLALFLAAEMNADGNAPFGLAHVDCVEVVRLT